MFGLKRDFVQNGGTFMVLDRAEGVSSSEISRVQKEMILSSRIPHMLPLYIKEMDYHITLEYNITGKKMLSQSLKCEKLTLTEFYGLLLQAVTALQDSATYMLRPEQYILDEDYMFIEGSLRMGVLYLTYVPIQGDVSKPEEAMGPKIRDFLTRLVVYVSELKGGGVQTLMQYCGSEEFNLNGLKCLLIELMTGEDGNRLREEHDGSGRFARGLGPNGGYAAPAVPDGQASGASTGMSRIPVAAGKNGDHEARSDSIFAYSALGGSRQSGGTVTDQDVREPYPGQRWPHGQTGGRQDLPQRMNELPAFLKGKVMPEAEGGLKRRILSDSERTGEGEGAGFDEDYSDEVTSASSLRTYWLLGGLLGMAAIWRFLYMDNPSGGMLGLSVVATCVLGVVSVLGWKGKIGRFSGSADSGSIPLSGLDSEELDYGGKAGKKRFRFQADKLTGFLQGKGRQKEEASDDENFGEAWRWNASPSNVSSPWRKENDLKLPWRDGNGSIPRQEYGSLMTGLPPEQKIEERFHGRTDEEDYYRSLGGRTEILTSPDDGGTVLLQPNADGGHAGTFGRPNKPSAYLEVSFPEQGGKERVELSQPHFIIGRSAEVSQYVARTAGISRAHVELSRSSDGYVIKDLGSKNGTILKDELMVPYKEYPLQEGDVFIIAGDRYTFHAS